MKKGKTLLILVAVVLVCSTLLTFTLTSKNVIFFKKAEMILNPDNLIGVNKVNWAKNISRGGVTFTMNEDGSWHVYGTATEAFGVYLTLDRFRLEEGKSYMLSSGMERDGLKSYYLCINEGSNLYVGDLEPAYGNYMKVDYGPFTCTDSSLDYSVEFVITYAGAVIDDVIYPCLVEGTQPGSFYIEKTP